MRTILLLLMCISLFGCYSYDEAKSEYETSKTLLKTVKTKYLFTENYCDSLLQLGDLSDFDFQGYNNVRAAMVYKNSIDILCNDYIKYAFNLEGEYLLMKDLYAYYNVIALNKFEDLSDDYNFIESEYIRFQKIQYSDNVECTIKSMYVQLTEFNKYLKKENEKH